MRGDLDTAHQSITGKTTSSEQLEAQSLEPPCSDSTDSKGQPVKDTRRLHIHTFKARLVSSENLETRPGPKFGMSIPRKSPLQSPLSCLPLRIFWNHFVLLCNQL